MTGSTFGDLIEISMIDGRQYRSREACYGPPFKGGGHVETNETCPERLSAARTMMGFAQEAWLYAGFANSKAQWNLIGQDVLMAQYKEKQNGLDGFWTDIGMAIRPIAPGCSSGSPTQSFKSGGGWRRYSFVLRQ